METSGAFGTEALDLFAEISRLIRTATQEIGARAFLLQQVSVALQCGNAASVLGSMSLARSQYMQACLLVLGPR